MTTTPTASSGSAASTPLKIGLWTAQAIVFVLFTLLGGMKLLMPVDKLAGMWVWPGQVPTWFLHLTGILDVAGGIGLVSRCWRRLAVPCCRLRRSSSTCLAAKPPLCRSMLSSSLCQYSFFGDVGDKHPLRLVAENIESGV
jgi:hypothetical protein